MQTGRSQNLPGLYQHFTPTHPFCATWFNAIDPSCYLFCMKLLLSYSLCKQQIIVPSYSSPIALISLKWKIMAQAMAQGLFLPCCPGHCPYNRCLEMVLISYPSMFFQEWVPLMLMSCSGKLVRFTLINSSHAAHPQSSDISLWTLKSTNAGFLGSEFHLPDLIFLNGKERHWTGTTGVQWQWTRWLLFMPFNTLIGSYPMWAIALDFIISWQCDFLLQIVFCTLP